MTKYKSIYEQLGIAEEKLDAMKDEVARLRAELAQARKDTERKDAALKLAREWMDDFTPVTVIDKIDAILSPLQDEKAE